MDFKHRFKCKVVAVVDLIWWVVEFSYLLVMMLGMRLKYIESLPEDYEGPDIIRFTFMNMMGWNMLIPVLQFIYMVVFILQVGVTCVLIRNLKGECSMEDAEGACSMFCRISVLSLLALIVLYIFPYMNISTFHICYMSARCIFVIVAIPVVNLHRLEIRKVITFDREERFPANN